jgi:folate-binding protein YgfZ
LDEALRQDDYGTLAVRGRAAAGFLQAQLSAEIGARALLAAWLDARGRVLCLPRVLPADDGYLLVMPAPLVAAIASRMRLFVLRSAVTLVPGPGVILLAGDEARQFLADASLLPEGPWAVARRDAMFALGLPGDGHWIAAGVDTGRSAGFAAQRDAWRLADLSAGLPEVYPATSGMFVAQMINLDLLGAVSFTKGCFPGQEIVARAHYLGRVKRRARLFSATGPAPPPGAMLAEDRGQIVRSAPAPDGSLLMAVVAESDEGPFRLPDGSPLSPVTG